MTIGHTDVSRKTLKQGLAVLAAGALLTGATWRGLAAGAVLAAAPALIALGTATASQAQTSSTSPSFSPAPTQTAPQYPYSNAPWYDSSFHHRHAAEVQSYYQ